MRLLFLQTTKTPHATARITAATPVPIPAAVAALNPSPATGGAEPAVELTALSSAGADVLTAVLPLSDPDDVVDGWVAVGAGPNVTLLPFLSSPMILKAGLLPPKPATVLGRKFSQHGVADVKLSVTGTVALNPGAGSVKTRSRDSQ